MINYPKYSDIDEDIDDVLRDFRKIRYNSQKNFRMIEYIILNLEEDLPQKFYYNEASEIVLRFIRRG